MNIFSLCITTYNRFEMLMESFAGVLDNENIGEIVIVDDASDEAIYQQIKEAVAGMPKVRLHRNTSRMGMGNNKAIAISLASYPWVCIFDSDNIVSNDYFTAVLACPSFGIDEYTMFLPEWAEPTFDYREFAGSYITKHNVAEFIDKPMFDCMLNTCNMVVHRDSYLEVFELSKEHIASDTIWFNFLWLKKGHMFHVVPSMRYFHRTHSGSGFLENAQYNLDKAAELKELIRNLENGRSIIGW